MRSDRERGTRPRLPGTSGRAARAAAAVLAALLWLGPWPVGTTAASQGDTMGSRHGDTTGASQGEEIRLSEIGADGPLSDSALRRLFGSPGSGELRSALERIGAALLAEGHLEAELHLVAPGAAPLPSGEWPATATEAALLVRAGPEARWQALHVAVRGGAEVEEVRPWSPEGAFSLRRLEEELVAWTRRYGEEGYPFVVAEVESLAVRDGRVVAGVRFDPGPRVTVGEIVFPGRTASRQSFLQDRVGFRAGERYRESDLLRRQRRLERTGLFAWVGDPRIEPLEPGAVRVHYPVEERLHNRIEGALGYAGRTETVSGRVDVEMGNLFGTGRAVHLRWERLREDDSRLDLGYREPMVLGLPLALEFQVFQQVEDTTFTLDRFEVAALADVALDLQATVGVELRRSVLGSAPSDLVRRRSTVFGLEWETLRPGRFEGRRVEGTFRTGRSRYELADGTRRSERLDRVDAAFESYWHPLGRGEAGWTGVPWVVRTAIRGGGLSGSVDRSLPPSEALWIGGLEGPRGWDEEAFATRRYFVGQVELGVLLAGESGRAYLFSDAAAFRLLAGGGGWTEEGGWGVGLESESGRRALVVDYGVPWGGSVREGRIHLRVRTRF